MDEFDPLLLTRRTAEVLAAGVTAKTLRGRHYVKTRQGIVRPEGAESAPLLARLSEAIAVAGTSCAIGGWASLYMHGNTWFDGIDSFGSEQDVLIFCLPGSQLRQRLGLRPSEARLYFDEISDRGPYRLTSMARAAYDEMRLAPSVRTAVVALDMTVSATTRLPHANLDEVRGLVEAHHKTRGIVRARSALELASARSASPAESRTRLIAVLDAGLKGLLVNCPVFDRNENLLGVADLFDPSCGLVIETDGPGHREEFAHADDNVREESFERAGCVVIRVTAIDRRDQVAVTRRMRGGYRDACAATRRNWTLEKPAWWYQWPPARRWD